MPEQHAAEGGRVTLCLLGGWQLLVGGVDVPLRHREQRLTALLGLTGRRARAHVAGTLWPETTDARALASLRRSVLQVRQRSPGLLLVDRTHIGLDPDVDVDVVAVRRAARATELPPSGAASGADADALLAALVGEPLLPAWYDDWVLPEREHIEQLRVRALERIARQAFATGDLVRAIDAARAALDIDPLLESARELTIRAHLGQGDRGSALREFHRHRDAMRDQLEVAPSTAIQALVETVLTDAGAASGAPEGGAGAGPTPAPGATVPEPLRMEDLHVPITPVPQAAIPRPDRVPPPPAPLAGPVLPAPPTRVESDEPGGPWSRVALLLAVGVLVLVASVALAGEGPGRGDPDDRGGARSPGPAPAPAGPDVRAGSGTGDVPTGPRQVMVRPAKAGSGSATLLVRATRRPASVRVVMRGPEGSVLRRVVVRSEDGRRLVLDGLDPGTYRWLATSPTAAPVTGQVTVADRPVLAAPPPEATTPIATHVTMPATLSPEPTSQSVPPTSAQQAGPAPQPSPTTPSTQQPTAQPTRQPTPTPAPQPTRQPTPSHQPSPAGDPTDPGTLEPTPVG